MAAVGGAPRRLTPLTPSYWHGWSPDGKTLAYVGQRDGEYDIYTMPVAGGRETRLTTAKGLDDGPDYTPDGQWIYFNSVRTGTMRIWRMRPDGSDQQQVTFDAQYADWFPHPSPDGTWLVWISFDASVEGHPPYKDVVLRLMPLGRSEGHAAGAVSAVRRTGHHECAVVVARQYAIRVRVIRAALGQGRLSQAGRRHF